MWAWLSTLSTVPIPDAGQLDILERARDIILSPGGAVALLLLLTWAIFYRRVIPRSTHDLEIATQKESYEKAIKDRDATIEKLERRAERWEQYAIFGRQTLRTTLEAAEEAKEQLQLPNKGTG